MRYEIKNLMIIDMNELYHLSIKNCNEYTARNEIKNKKDVDSLFKHFFLVEFLQIYEQNNLQNVLLYLNDLESFDKNFEKLLKLLFVKFKFPNLKSGLKINDFIELLSADSPQYDDIICNNFNFIDKFNDFRYYLKKNGLLYLSDNFSDINLKLKLLLSIKPRNK